MHGRDQTVAMLMCVSVTGADTQTNTKPYSFTHASKFIQHLSCVLSAGELWICVCGLVSCAAMLFHVLHVKSVFYVWAAVRSVGCSRRDVLIGAGEETSKGVCTEISCVCRHRDRC